MSKSFFQNFVWIRNYKLENLVIVLDYKVFRMKDWTVAVFKVKPETIKRAVVDFYRFVEALEGVVSLHFLIRDRVDDKVVFSFRVLSEPDKLKIVSSKMKYKLGLLLEKDAFSVDPEAADPLAKYIAWSIDDRIAKSGADKFDKFYKLLETISRMAIDMLESNYFGSSERVELAHVTSWILGCTEYGVLDTKHWELGYFDRIENRYQCYLRKDFPSQ